LEEPEKALRDYDEIIWLEPDDPSFRDERRSAAERAGLCESEWEVDAGQGRGSRVEWGNGIGRR